MKFFFTVLMSDAVRAEIIMALDEPCEINEQGEAVTNFYPKFWAIECREVVEKGNMAKVYISYLSVISVLKKLRRNISKQIF